jgi:hypothetical protein
VITFTAPIWIWSANKGSWHFVTVPGEQSLEIRSTSFMARGGFGSVKVQATIGDLSWRTSAFPQKKGTYLLPRLKCAAVQVLSRGLR